MKPLKKANQKNVTINTDYYSKAELENMWYAGEIFNLLKYGKIDTPHNIGTFDSIKEDYDFRIFLENVKDLKVAVEDGYYVNVAIGNNGKTYYVNL